MNLIQNITNLAANMQENNAVKNPGKVIWISIEKIKIDPELKGIFKQRPNDIQNIADDMKVNGFDGAHPIILSQNYENVDGHTRYEASKIAGLKKVAVIFKHFDSREEMIEYAYKQQLNRRNLDDSEVFKAWEALNRLTNAEGKKAKTDVEIAEQLEVSPRQVAKMKEVEKKASAETLGAFKKGEITLNKAYTQMKEETAVVENKIETDSVKEESLKSDDDSSTVIAEAVTTLPSQKAAVSKESEKSAKPQFEKIILKFSPEDFLSLSEKAKSKNLTVQSYIFNLAKEKIKAE